MAENCTTCAHAAWVLTPTGRIQRSKAGRCSAQPAPAVLPVSFTVTYSRTGIWPDMGEGCPLWLQKTTDGLAML